jgi:hypothetical protein
MNKPKREDYANDVEFRIAYMQWRREQIAARQQSEESNG